MNVSSGHTLRRRFSPGAFGASLAALALLACSDARALADCGVSTTGVAFGAYDPTIATDTDSTGNVQVVCTHLSGGASQVNYTLALSTGNSGTYVQRWLRSGAAMLKYNLFDTAARSRIWGNGSAATALVSGSLRVNPGSNRIREASHPIYGRIPALQAAPTGNYTDTILVTVAF